MSGSIIDKQTISSYLCTQIKIKNMGKYRFDLPGYVLSRLEHAGIGAAEWVGKDTYSMEKEYFSYRRSSQKGESCGRQISVIGLLDGALF